MGHRTHIVLVIFFFNYVSFIHFILDIINGVVYPVKQLDHFLGN